MTARMRQTPSKARNHPPKFPANKNEAKKVNLKQKSTGRLYKTLNLNTYKDHSLGDYVESIRQNGTIDSYSTELVNIPYYCILLIAYHIAQTELEHRSPKSRYRRTSRKNFEKQLCRIERRQARICQIRQKLKDRQKTQEVFDHEKGPKTTTHDYHIGNTQNHPIDLGILAGENCHDPAAKVFLSFYKFQGSSLILFIEYRVSLKTQ